MQSDSIFKNIIVSFQDSGLTLNSFIKYRKLIGKRDVVSYILGIKDSEVISRFERGETVMSPPTITLFLLLSDTHPRYELTTINQLFIVKKLLIESPSTSKLRKQKRHNIELMTGEKLTQQGMADLLGLTGKSLISKYESGKKNPSVQIWTLFLLATNQHPFYKLSNRTNGE